MANLTGSSASATVPAVSGTNTATGGGDGVVGTGWRGVVGISNSYQGVYGISIDNAGVVGESTHLHGIYGVCHNPNGAGVFGTNDKGGFGLQGVSTAGRGVTGSSTTGAGIYGEAVSGRAIEGWSQSNYGVSGDSQTSAGVRGTSVQGNGTEGWTTSGDGVLAISKTGVALHAIGGRVAGRFEGDVEVTGDIRLELGDCAEDFDIGVLAEPGTVMVLGDNGDLLPSHTAYDKRVAGVLSGAGDFKPGIILDKQNSTRTRLPVGLLGKVYCKVDAQTSPIEVGDLLTTSAIPGHAMKVTDPLKAFGTVIGKALRPLHEGQGLIPILIALQ
jgi:hypothetical protein